ncbi:MAG: hypothetical protein HMLKMBBP_02360 [Planctomycetes bacterium]|nr:hypothetical protein [Planctomycetota bacterium]
MLPNLARIAAWSAVYGYAIGHVHGPVVAARNLAKFPLLILVTATLCALSFHAFTAVLVRGARLGDVVRLSLATYADIALLLASLAPVSLFLSLTHEPPGPEGLAEYPLVLGVNVAFIAVCGALALARRTLRFAAEQAISRRRAAAVLACWLATSLFAGGQCAWYMRPFFGRRTEPDPPFMRGRDVEADGISNFYEAVWELCLRP